MRICGIIPARSGSRGVPGKNTRVIRGKPLMAYSIEAAIRSGVMETIVVSSDDPGALEIAGAYPGVRPLFRSPELAGDRTPITPVIRHALEHVEKEGSKIDAILLLQPTAPLRESWHIREAVTALDGPFNSVISVCEMRDLHPARMYRLEANRRLQPMMPDWEEARRQDIPPAYYRNGSIYLVRRDAFVRQGTVMARPARGYVMGGEYLLNIDERRDMIIAEALIAAWVEGRL